MKRPAVSVIIPTRMSCWRKGREREYFRAALRSVLSQSYEDYEVIVVHPPHVRPDRKSGGGQGERVGQGFSPAKVRYVPSHGPRVGAARNAGLRSARGEWIAFLDSDDLWFPHKLKAQMRRAGATPKCDCVHSDAIGFYRGRKACETERLSSVGQPIQGHLTEESVGRQGYFILTSSLMMRKKVWVEVGPFDETLWACEDEDFFLRASREHLSIGYIAEPLLLFRIKRKRIDLRFLRQKARIHLTQGAGCD